MLNEMANECLGAQWVRAKGESADALDRTQAVLFRLEIEVNAPVKRAEIRISAADRYRLYVNGESVVCGPRKGDALNRYFETVDLAPYLKSGRNALNARVISYAYDCATGGIGAPKSVYVAPTGAVLMCRGEVETLEGKIARPQARRTGRPAKTNPLRCTARARCTSVRWRTLTRRAAPIGAMRKRWVGKAR